MLEPLEFRYAKANAKDKDKVLPGPCILVWEKSPRLSRSKPVDGKDGKIVWAPAPQTHPLELIITMYKKDKKFLSKKTSLKARIITTKGEEKTIGKCEIDVADYCVDKEISHPAIEIKMGGDCIMKCRIHSRPLPQGAAGGGDDISMMSGLSTLEEPSTASDWAAGFGKNADDSKPAKGALDSDDDDDDNGDDDDDFAGFRTSRSTKPKSPANKGRFEDNLKADEQSDVNAIAASDDDDEFVGITIPDDSDRNIIEPELEAELSKVMNAEIVSTVPVVEIAKPIQIDNTIDDDSIAKLQSSADHTKCEEFFTKYKAQIEQLHTENSSYHHQLQTLTAQHTQDIERFQGIVTLSQTSLNKMQDVVTEYKRREENYSLQLNTLQNKIKNDEKQWNVENKKLLKQNQINAQDIVILNSKVTTLKETIRHKEEAEQRLVIQMKTTGDTESILLGQKTQLESKLSTLQNDLKSLQDQLDSSIKERDEKVELVQQHEKSIDKLKSLIDEYKKQNDAFKTDLSNAKESSLVQAQKYAQLEHNLAVKQQELDVSKQLVEKKDQELVQIKALVSQNDKNTLEKEQNNAEILKQFSILQEQVYSLENEKAGLKSQNENLVKENGENKKQFETLQNDLKSAAQQHSGKDSALQQQLAALQSTVSALEAFKINALEKEKNQNEQIQVLSQEKTKLAAIITANDKDIAKLREDNTKFNTQCTQLNEDVKNRDEKYNQLEIEFNNVGPKLATAEKLTIDLKAQIKSQEENVSKLQNEKNKLVQIQQELRDNIVELEHDNTNFTTSVIPNLEKSIKVYRTTIETQNENIEKHEVEIAALSAALEALKSTKNAPSSPIVTAAIETQSPSEFQLEEGYERIATSELLRIKDEISFLSTTLDKRTDKIQTLNTEIERLHEEHEEFLQLRQQMEEDFGELEHERDELDQKLNVISTKFEVLQQQHEKLKSSQVDVDSEELKSLRSEADALSEQYHQVKERNEQMKAENSKIKSELNKAESLVTELNTGLRITETKLENSEANCKNVLEKSTELAAQLNIELTRAHLENRALRDRIHTFDTLTATITAIISNSPQFKGAKLESRIVEELIGKIDYYQNQLAEADETLLQTKSTWKQTADVLTRRILDLESQLKQMHKEKTDLEHARDQDEGEQSKMKSTLTQQQQKQEKFQEALSKFEIQLIAKRVEITELTKERDMYKEQIEMYENNIQSYEQQLNAASGEIEQLRETLAAVSGGGKKSKKPKQQQQQQQQQQRQQQSQDYDLDDADF